MLLASVIFTQCRYSTALDCASVAQLVVLQCCRYFLAKDMLLSSSSFLFFAWIKKRNGEIVSKMILLRRVSMSS